MLKESIKHSCINHWCRVLGTSFVLFGRVHLSCMCLMTPMWCWCNVEGHVFINLCKSSVMHVLVLGWLWAEVGLEGECGEE
jgi:hypothetical protein